LLEAYYLIASVTHIHQQSNYELVPWALFNCPLWKSRQFITNNQLDMSTYHDKKTFQVLYAYSIIFQW